MIVENIILRNVIINRGAVEVDNHTSRDDIFDYHPLRECNIYILYQTEHSRSFIFYGLFSLRLTMVRGVQRECMNERYIFHKNGSVFNSLNARTDHGRSMK